jgi:hypothetical protein
LVGVQTQALLDVCEVPAQDVRDVHVDGRQCDHDGEQFAQARAAAAVLAGNTQSAQACLPHQIDCSERPFAGALAFECALADRGDQLGQPIRAVGQGLGVRLCHRHRITSSFTRR